MQFLTKRYFALIFLIVPSCLLSAQVTQGFFLEGNNPKQAPVLSYIEFNKPDADPTVFIKVIPTDTMAEVSKYIYGNNSNVYMTQMITEEKLMYQIRLLSPNVIRYPGGNLSNLFFWNAAPGDLPGDVPDPLWSGVETRYKENFWFGNNNGDSTLSVDNYYKMLESSGADGMICVNYSYARYGSSKDPVAVAAHLAAEWVRYDRGQTRYWEIGNENYGSWQAGYRIDTNQNKDGQPEFITGELYGKHFKVFADSMRAAAAETGIEIKIGAVMVEVEKSYGTEKEKSWNDDFLKTAGNTADFFVVHSYYTPYMEDSDVPVILNSASVETKKMADHMRDVCMRNQVEMKPIALTEWNVFAIRSKQSCSYISGMHAALVLGELIKNQYGLACRWNFANGYANGDDHGIFNLGDEPGVPKWNPRPAFFYMYYFQQFFGDHMVKSIVEGSDSIVVYSSVFNSGETGLVIFNKGNRSNVVEINLEQALRPGRYYYYSLTGGKDNGDFSQQVFVNGYPPSNKTGGPIDTLEEIKAWSCPAGEEGIIIESPAFSVQYIRID
jgi:hypothetical protein